LDVGEGKEEIERKDGEEGRDTRNLLDPSSFRASFKAMVAFSGFPLAV
jgi:hypothetical protein